MDQGPGRCSGSRNSDQEDLSDLDAAIDGELPEAPESLGGDTEDLDPGVPADDCCTLHVHVQYTHYT